MIKEQNHFLKNGNILITCSSLPSRIANTLDLPHTPPSPSPHHHHPLALLDELKFLAINQHGGLTHVGKRGGEQGPRFLPVLLRHPTLIKLADHVKQQMGALIKEERTGLGEGNHFRQSSSKIQLSLIALFSLYACQ